MICEPRQGFVETRGRTDRCARSTQTPGTIDLGSRQLAAWRLELKHPDLALINAYDVRNTGSDPEGCQDGGFDCTSPAAIRGVERKEPRCTTRVDVSEHGFLDGLFWTGSAPADWPLLRAMQALERHRTAHAAKDTLNLQRQQGAR